MKEFIKRNWFKILVLLTLLIIGIIETITGYSAAGIIMSLYFATYLMFEEDKNRWADN